LVSEKWEGKYEDGEIDVDGSDGRRVRVAWRGILALREGWV